MTQPCPACTAAAASPHSGVAQDGCRACWVRRIAAMPTMLRREIYRATPGDDLAQLQADVKAEYLRRLDRLRGVFAAETRFVRAGDDG